MMYASSGCSLLALVAAAVFTATPLVAQTTTKCNPLTQTCPPDPALGTSVTVDFTKGIPNLFTSQGNPTTSSNGLALSVDTGKDAPTVVSTFYIMFGRVDVTLKTAAGQGIVSSVVLQSDDLDEIDLEWLGGDNTQVQTNYFGKGKTDFYDRGAFSPNQGNQDSFITYTIDWTADQITWEIAGNTIRTLTPQTAHTGEYPQTPMQVKLGSWSGGDPANAPGTIEWAGGPTNYAACPCTMLVKSLTVTDYSTGTSYSYGGTDGTWQSITSSGGKVNPQGSGSDPAPSSVAAAADPSSSAAPTVPAFDQSRGTSSTPTSSHPTTYSGLPSGWTVSSSGKSSDPTSSSMSPSSSPALASISPSNEGGPSPLLTSLSSVTASASARTTSTMSTSSTAPPFTGGSTPLSSPGLLCLWAGGLLTTIWIL